MRIDGPLEGGCHCGAIRYRASAVFDAGYCHCSICRRISGSAADKAAAIKAAASASRAMWLARSRSIAKWPRARRLR